MTNTQNSTHSFGCEICKDQGFIVGDNNTVTICDCRKASDHQRKMDKLFRAARIPRLYQGVTLKNTDPQVQPDALAAAKSYIDSWPVAHGLMFVGPVGTGKTHLAVMIQNEIIARHKVKSLMVSVPDLMDDLRQLGDEYGGRINALKTVDLLVLDDLGAQKNTEWVTERLYVVINARYADMLPTVITSNSLLSELSTIPGWERIVDRIVESCIIKTTDGESHRRSIALKKLKELEKCKNV